MTRNKKIAIGILIVVVLWVCFRIVIKPTPETLPEKLELQISEEPKESTQEEKSEIIGRVEYCTTACHWFEGRANYCSLESTEEYTKKVQIRNRYNDNTIQCYLMDWVNEKSSIMMGHPSGEVTILLTEEAFMQLKGDKISSIGIEYLE